MKKILFLNIVLLISIFTGYAADLNKLVRDANQFCKTNQFDKAINNYETILKNGYTSADVYYNLGYAYFKSKNTSKAILNFERAKLLDPSNTDIADNLEYARSFTVDKIDSIPEVFLIAWFKALRNLLSLNAWTVLTIVFFTITLTLFLIYLLTNQLHLKKIAFWTGTILIIFTIWSFSSAYSHYSDLTGKNTAIVFSPVVNIKSSPDETGNNLFILHEGTKVKIIDRVGDWCEIIISSGGRGFIKASDIEVI